MQYQDAQYAHHIPSASFQCFKELSFAGISPQIDVEYTVSATKIFCCFFSMFDLEYIGGLESLE